MEELRDRCKWDDARSRTLEMEVFVGIAYISRGPQSLHIKLHQPLSSETKPTTVRQCSQNFNI